MTGSAFITHNDTWSCTNECKYSFTNTPVFEPGNDMPIATKQGFQLSVQHVFHASIPYEKGTPVQVVFKDDAKNIKYGFNGEVQHIGKEYTTIKLFTKTDKISEILSNITFKN